jgi:hypothetical protein
MPVGTSMKKVFILSGSRFVFKDVEQKSLIKAVEVSMDLNKGSLSPGLAKIGLSFIVKKQVSRNPFKD